MVKILTLLLLLVTCVSFGQVSHQSRPLQSSPYVSPIDQNLVFDALRNKQTSYDSGVKEISSQIKRTSRAIQELNEVKPEYAKKPHQVKLKLISFLNENRPDLSDSEVVDAWVELFEKVEFDALKELRN